MQLMVTGINGFVGKHLAKELKIQGHEVIGIGREKSASDAAKPAIDSYYQCDLTSVDDVSALPFESAQAVVHLAGMAAVGPSFDHPSEYINSNTAMVVNMGEVALKKTVRPRFVIASSGALYDANQSLPLTEKNKVAFNSPYVVSKVAVENLGQYYINRGLEVIIARPFNHIGPGQGEGFLLPDLTAQLLSINTGDEVKVGNLATKRDYTDVRDVVKAYVLLATQKKLPTNVYNICSGASHSGQEIFDLLVKILGLHDVKAQPDQAKLRPTDALDIYGDNSRIHEDTQWQPVIPFEQSVRDYVAWLKQRT